MNQPVQWDRIVGRFISQQGLGLYDLPLQVVDGWFMVLKKIPKTSKDLQRYSSVVNSTSDVLSVFGPFKSLNELGNFKLGRVNGAD